MSGSSEASAPPLAAGLVIDLSGQGLQKLGTSLPCPEDTLTLILDKNQIIKLEHLEKCKNLMQLSVANNRLVRMMGVAELTRLRVLNLPYNSIGYVEGLRDLVYLEWLNLAGNNLKTIDQINSCTSLLHLDLSDNDLHQIGDLSRLINLKTLLLHGNSITSLRTASTCLPHSLTILSLAENEIRDLNEISFLAYLRDLEQLSIMNNPCVLATPSIPGFDYRPYAVSWCLNLKVLDGYVVSQKESLKAEWLYSQGKGRAYRPGQHVPLVQYLASVCHLTSAVGLQTAEDAKLEKILNKQRFHQRQLMHQCNEEENPSSSTPNRDLTSSEYQSLLHGKQSPLENESVVQLDSWLVENLSEDCAYTMRNIIPNSTSTDRANNNEMHLEDFQTDEDKLNCSLLSSESTFMPVAAGLSPISSAMGKWISEMNCEEQANNSVLKCVKMFHEGDGEKQENAALFTTENVSKESKREKKNENKLLAHSNRSSSCTDLLPRDIKYPTCSVEAIGDIQRNMALNVKKTSTETIFPKESNCDSSIATDENSYWFLQRNKAATKLQACWRGFHTRKYNPKAKNVRYEIRLSRMQEHIIFLSAEVSKLKNERKREQIQRLVQEEAVKVLWSQVQSLRQWQLSIIQQLTSNCQPSVQASRSFCPSHFSVHSPNSRSESTTDLASFSQVRHENSSSDFPESSFHSILVDHALFKDSICFEKSSIDQNGDSGLSEETVKQLNTADRKWLSDIQEYLEDCGEFSKNSSKSEEDHCLHQQYLKPDEQLPEFERTSCSDQMQDSRPHTDGLQGNRRLLSLNVFPEPHNTFNSLQNDVVHMTEISQSQEIRQSQEE